MKGVRTAAVGEPPTAAATRTVAPVAEIGTAAALIMPPKTLASSNKVDERTDGQVQVRWKVFMQYLSLGLCTESYCSRDKHLYCLICVISAWCGCQLKTGDRMLRTFAPCRDDAAASHMNGNFPEHSRLSGCWSIICTLLLMHQVMYLAGVAVQEICLGPSSPKMGLLSIQLRPSIIADCTISFCPVVLVLLRWVCSVFPCSHLLLQIMCFVQYSNLYCFSSLTERFNRHFLCAPIDELAFASVSIKKSVCQTSCWDPESNWY